MHTWIVRLMLLTLAAVFVAPTTNQAAEPVTFKMGTLAPEGSPWLNKWYEVVEAAEARSPVPTKIVTYPGGVMGDEPDMVRKLKFNQLQMLGVTTSGIAQLMPEILVLNLPFLFNDYKEVDYVVEKLFPRFQSLAEERGLFLMAMLDQGMIQAFSKKQVATAEEFMSQRVWIWNADPVAIKLADVLGINSVMLPVPEVLTSLQTGLVDTMFSSTTALVALQWHTQMKYYYNIKLRYDPAAMFTTTKALNQLPAEHQETYKQVIKDVTEEYMKPFLTELRDTEEELGEMLMTEGGLKMVEWNEKDVAPVRADALKTWDMMAGEFYPPELLADVKAALAEYRSGAGAGAAKN